MKISIFIFSIIIFFLSFSCSNNEQIFEVSKKGWHKDSICSFNFNSTDTGAIYILDFIIENNNDYPNSNLFLFVSILTPDNELIGDTVNYWLADKNGRWLGDKESENWKSYLRYENLLIFKKKGKYKFNVIQGMRYDNLLGIKKVGILLKKFKKN
jgi:gliding motility-associated lipoprotein GldH